MAADDIAASFDGGRFRPAALSAAEQRLARGLAGRSLTHPEMPRAVACDLPDWLEPHLAAVYGRHLEDEMAALNAPAPIDLRVNALKADRDDRPPRARRRTYPRRADPVVAARPRLKHRAPLAGTRVQGGLVEVQDEGSQLAALLADARPGMRVVDFCAGAGGKTLALAAQMQNRGKLVACDVADWRLERAGQRLRRAGISNVERRAAVERARSLGQASREELRPGVCRRAVPRDRQLAPQPGRQMARPPQDLAELVVRQRDILASAARLVKPGGRLVYATCSLLRRGERGAGRSLSRRPPRFHALPGGARLGRDHRRPLTGGRRLSPPDPRPPRHGRLLRRDLRARKPPPRPSPQAGEGAETAPLTL